MTKTLAAIKFGAISTAIGAGVFLFGGCHNSSAPAQKSEESASTTQAWRAASTNPANDQVLAMANGIPITRQDLDQPLIESFGLHMLLNIVQLKLAQQQVARIGSAVTQQDVQNERKIMLATMLPSAAPEDYEKLLDQFLAQRNITRTQFEMLVETNANLRKIAQPHMAGAITDDMVQKAFGQFYGENRQIQDIELSNIQEWAEAKRRIDNGEPFEKVAAAMSKDAQTRALGGEWPPFSAHSPNVPDQIKTSAFSMQVGQLSDIIHDGNSYHLIKLVRIIPPKIVKFEDVRDSVRKTLEEQWMQLAYKDILHQLGQIALTTMKIEDPTLRAQWQAELDAQMGKERDRDAIRNDIVRRRQQMTTAPTTAPSTVPAVTVPTPPPPPAPSGPSGPPAPATAASPVVTPAATGAERPPATGPGASAPGAK